MTPPPNNNDTAPLMLAGDTSTGYCTVSLCQCDTDSGLCTPISTVAIDSKRLHSERLLGVVEWVLKEADLSFDALSCLAMTTGPGSFTGLRVGLAFWKGLAFALKLPLISVPTLDAMTRINAFPEGTLVPLIDARMKEVFGAIYRYEAGVRTKVLEDQAAPIDLFIEAAMKEKGPFLFLGDGAEKYSEAILSAGKEVYIAPLHCGLPRAEAVAAEALELWMQTPDHDPALAVPRYHRLSQAEQARAAREASEAEVASSGGAEP